MTFLCVDDAYDARQAAGHRQLWFTHPSSGRAACLTTSYRLVLLQLTVPDDILLTHRQRLCKPLLLNGLVRDMNI